MQSTSTPLVSVVTPVYNGAKYLEQCIESVISQSYRNWEYFIVDNCSTDRSPEIAAAYAAKDGRIRVIHNDRNLPAVDNWNLGLRLVSEETAYCRILHADDYLFPDCLSRMVELGEANPSVIMVSSLVLIEKTFAKSDLKKSGVANGELFSGVPVRTGHETARLYLLSELPRTCTPSSLLIRWGPLRRERLLYDASTGILSALDRQAFLELLQEGDFGFVDEVLTCAREHPLSMTSRVYLGVSSAEKLLLLRRFSSLFLTADEYNDTWSRELSLYYQFLGRSVFLLRGFSFWRFHSKRLRQLGCPISYQQLAFNALRELGAAIRDMLSGYDRALPPQMQNRTAPPTN
jgi:glycosyltransferase involved in cell wall biosynthesis